jgi:hypothetical protein
MIPTLDGPQLSMTSRSHNCTFSGTMAIPKNAPRFPAYFAANNSPIAPLGLLPKRNTVQWTDLFGSQPWRQFND